jgi:hypothetical protein
MRYKYTSLKFLEQNLPEIKKRKVSVKARSRGQFVEQFRKAGGNPDKLPEKWQKKRDNFVARMKKSMELHKLKGHKINRQKLSLVAWAYKP